MDSVGVGSDGPTVDVHGQEEIHSDGEDLDDTRGVAWDDILADSVVVGSDGPTAASEPATEDDQATVPTAPSTSGNRVVVTTDTSGGASAPAAPNVGNRIVATADTAGGASEPAASTSESRVVAATNASGGASAAEHPVSDEDHRSQALSELEVSGPVQGQPGIVDVGDTRTEGPAENASGSPRWHPVSRGGERVRDPKIPVAATPTPCSHSPADSRPPAANRRLMPRSQRRPNPPVSLEVPDGAILSDATPPLEGVGHQSESVPNLGGNPDKHPSHSQPATAHASASAGADGQGGEFRNEQEQEALTLAKATVDTASSTSVNAVGGTVAAKWESHFVLLMRLDDNEVIFNFIGVDTRQATTIEWLLDVLTQTQVPQFKSEMIRAAAGEMARCKESSVTFERTHGDDMVRGFSVSVRLHESLHGGQRDDDGEEDAWVISISTLSKDSTLGYLTRWAIHFLTSDWSATLTNRRSGSGSGSGSGSDSPQALARGALGRSRCAQTRLSPALVPSTNGIPAMGVEKKHLPSDRTEGEADDLPTLDWLWIGKSWIGLGFAHF